jgi:hypothetical protein
VISVLFTVDILSWTIRSVGSISKSKDYPWTDVLSGVEKARWVIS